MNKYTPSLAMLFLFWGVALNANAQLSDGVSSSVDDNEILFEEIFSDFSETEKDITKVKTFDDAVDKAAEKLKHLTADSSVVTVETKPLTGKMFIGIQKGSYKSFVDMAGRKKCSFKVALKSDLDRDIRTIAFNLIYPQRVFAFVFKDIKQKQQQIQAITTSGDICYNLGDVAPDINLHVCKIKGVLGADCIKHLQWSDNLR